MRWIFLFLVFLNLFFYIWQRQQADQETLIISNEASQIDKNIPTIKLLSEQPTLPKNTNNLPQPVTAIDASQSLTTEASNQPLLNDTTNQATCLYFGGVTNKDQLAVFIPYLTAINGTIKPIEIELKQPPKFHLYLNSADQPQQAIILAKLKALSLNALLSNKSSLKNQISLGNFTTQEEFLNIQQQLNEMKLALEIEPLKSSATSYWLKIAKDQQVFFTAELLNELAEKLPTMQQELMLCDFPEY